MCVKIKAEGAVAEDTFEVGGKKEGQAVIHVPEATTTL